MAGAHAAIAQQPFPSKPIRVLVPLAAGSTADIMARALGVELTKQLGQPMIIDNKPGAGGSIAMAELAHSTADGYTISLASQGSLIFNQSLYAKPGYNSVKDFAPIAMVGGVSNVMVVPTSSPHRSVADVIAAAKAKPGAVMYSSGGNGTSHHLSGALFSQLTGTELMHVPYKGAPQGTLAVMSGEVDMAFYNTPSVITQIKAGKLKALAVTGLMRSPLLPNVPTVDASGVKGYEVNTWFAFVARAGTPNEVIDRLRDAVSKSLASPTLRAQLSEQGVDVAKDFTPTYLSTVIKDDLAKWPAIIKASGAKVD